MNQASLPLNKTDADEELFASSSPVYVSPSSPVSSPTSPSYFSFDTSRQQREWRKALTKLEKEIESLQATLEVKSREVAELKRKLGITRIDELKEGVLHGYQTFKESEPVIRTNAALKTVGDFASRKFSDLRNSTAIKSVGEKVGDAYTSVRRKISSTVSEGGDAEPSRNSASAPPPEDGDRAFGEKVPL